MRISNQNDMKDTFVDVKSDPALLEEIVFDSKTCFGDRKCFNRVCREIDSFLIALKEVDLDYCNTILVEMQSYKYSLNSVERYIYHSLERSINERKICIYMEDLDTIITIRYSAITSEAWCYAVLDRSNMMRRLMDFGINME